MDNQHSLNEFHWIMDMVQTIDAGLVVLDKDFKVQLWNGFMSNHSGLSPRTVQDSNLFSHFTELPEAWLRSKIESVFLLKNNAFTSWEQRPYIFRFNNYRPVTGISEFMFQNMTIIPLASLTGEVTHVSLIIYDVTDIAINRLQLDKANEKLAHLSQTDALTQLNNRHHWNSLIDHEFKRVKRYEQISTLMMLDIDHFKNVNDTYGHVAGDKVIAAVSQVMRNNVRETDFAARYGGEEFAICLTNTSAIDAVILADRLRKAIEDISIIDDGNTIKVTISIGIAEFTATTDAVDTWTKNADIALYQSKANGRNQYTIFKL
ncbi:GGDEF domain-containing protein [Moritella viscosa]|uniref:GGDEF domain-containing protein n=1 Tax=Moritella viscosa TaxID=80854 RepID=UPI0009249513|nr:GGDEF domain-containing protein [Moritella viscosa]SGY87125.1 Sensory box/GGDEF family protein [Moritella viscosa]SGY87141.1 Sensory box/GGDEF family protein [Moritella viscosa]